MRARANGRLPSVGRDRSRAVSRCRSGGTTVARTAPTQATGPIRTGCPSHRSSAATPRGRSELRSRLLLETASHSAAPATRPRPLPRSAPPTPHRGHEFGSIGLGGRARHRCRRRIACPRCPPIPSGGPPWFRPRRPPESVAPAELVIPQRHDEGGVIRRGFHQEGPGPL